MPIPTVDPQPPALAGLHWFGIVQYIGNDRMEDWCEFYRELFGFERAARRRSASASCPRAASCRAAPCGSFYLQLIEPEPGILDVEGDESLQRIGLGAPDVPAGVAALRAAWRGLRRVDGRCTPKRAAR